MKVLVVHNKYKIRGGEDVSTEAEVALLRSHGIQVDTLYINNDSLDKKNLLGLALSTIWSNNYYQEVFDTLKNGQYDIMHVQNFFPRFSPSIFYAAKAAGVKVIMSVRNYRLVCPSASMYVNNKICTSCIGKKVPLEAIQHKCYRNDYLATATTVAMLSYHNIKDTWRKQIDGLICISNFVRDQLLTAGFHNQQLHVKYNFVNTTTGPNYAPSDYYIYVGRLSEEKGIQDILPHFIQSKRSLVIIGDGPLKKVVTDASSLFPNIKYYGEMSLNQVYEKIAMAKALIFPSRWHEPFGRTIIESFAHGTPVIGTALGAVTELIKNGINGYLYNPYKDNDLEAIIEKFEGNSNHGELRKNSYNYYIGNFLPEQNFKRIMEIYQNVLNSPQ